MFRVLVTLLLHARCRPALFAICLVSFAIRPKKLRLKRSAYWFLGEYCCQLTGTPTAAGSLQDLEQSPSSQTTPAGKDLLDVLALSNPHRPRGAGGKAGSLEGMETGATAVAHPVVSAMNGATVSILLRLKHAVMFEDFQVCLLVGKGGR